MINNFTQIVEESQIKIAFSNKSDPRELTLTYLGKNPAEKLDISCKHWNPFLNEHQSTQAFAALHSKYHLVS
jgi:hypothetical protein